MANTKQQSEVEKWVRNQHLPRQFGQVFEKKKMPLLWGGKFEFDAVSSDDRIVVSISTSGTRTARGKPASGKYHKIKSDALYLLHAKGVSNRVQVFTEPDMYDHFMDEKRAGRYPPEVELLRAKIPLEMRKHLIDARQVASEEVSPYET